MILLHEGMGVKRIRKSDGDNIEESYKFMVHITVFNCSCHEDDSIVHKELIYLHLVRKWETKNKILSWGKVSGKSKRK
jgi:hypothetical protein